MAGRINDGLPPSEPAMWLGRDTPNLSTLARRYPSIVPSIVAPEAQAATLKLLPKED